MITGIRHCLLVLALTPAVAAAQVFDARSMGRAGTGITFGDYNQALTNPALINRVGEDDDFAFGLNAGAVASDQEEAVDTIDTIQDDVDELEQRCTANPLACSSEDADPIRRNMQVIDQQLIQVDAGGAALVGVPLSSLRFALTVEATARVGGRFELDEDDIKGPGVPTPDPDSDSGGVLEDITEGQATEDDLESRVAASAVRMDEVSGIFGGRFQNTYDWGAKVKFQRIEIIDYEERVAAFEASDVLDDRNTEEHNGANLDLGFTRQPFDNGLSFGGKVTNLIPRTYAGPGHQDYELDPQLTLAGGWQTGWLKSEVSVEANKAKGFDILEDTRFARVGAEVSAGEHAHLRFGYRTDLENNVSELYTVGLGISPFDTVSLDLAGMVGEGDTYGAALQFGVKL